MNAPEHPTATQPADASRWPDGRRISVFGPIRPLDLDIRIQPPKPPAGPRVRQVRWQFGLAGGEPPIQPYGPLQLPLAPGRITLVAGPSGTGKSLTLRHLARRLGRRAIWVDDEPFDPRRAIVDQVATDRPLPEALALLAACGLGEPRLWLRRYHHLSEGERFRARLARSVARATRTGTVLLVDEFCAILHHRLACALAFNLRRLVWHRGLCLVAATARDDLLDDLQPDQVLVAAGCRPALRTCRPQRGPISFFSRLRIEPASLREYREFEAMHYRRRTGLGPVDKVFVLRDPHDGEPLGIVVYGYAPLSLRLRNRTVGGAYHRHGPAINRDFRILRRLVIHPDVRGCGLGRHLVAQTLPRLNTRYVECLAAMGAVNPVFERAGMIRIGTAGLPQRRQRLHAALRDLRIDPLRDDLAAQVESRADVRCLVTRTVRRWLEATTGRPIERIDRLRPRALAAAFIQLIGAEPVYYLWSSDAAEQARLRTLAVPAGLQEEKA